MRIIKTPRVLIKTFPSVLWKIPTNKKTIYLTFDDGPTLQSTPFVLSQLERYEAGATFFCVGDNIIRFRDIFSETLAQGHLVGNHTMNHLNGWRTKNEDYLINILDCEKLIIQSESIPKQLFFRPPYGKMNLAQYRQLKKKYIIVMWEVLTRDYNPGRNPEKLYEKIITSTGPGSIVVFHDSEKSFEGLKYLLPPFLAHFAGAGYNFATLENIS